MDALRITAGVVVDGRFVVEAPIGEGAFALVYRARDRETGERVALKTPNARALGDAEQVARFAREAQICGQLEHTNTARMIAGGAIDAAAGRPTLPYLVFEFVRGVPLGLLVDVRGHLGLREAVHVAVGLLASLDEAHGLGILHRDIKPNNVLVEAPPETWVEPDDGDLVTGRLGLPPLDEPVWWNISQLPIKVVDFGLGKLLQVGDRYVQPLTLVGMAAGTVQYMSPEQIRGRIGIDYAADIYATGMLIYRMLVGRAAYGGASAADVAYMHVHAPLPELPEPLADHPITAVFHRAVAKDPADRYPSAAEMAWDLRCAVEPELAGEPRPSFDLPPEVRQRSLFGRLFGRRR